MKLFLILLLFLFSCSNKLQPKTSMMFQTKLSDFTISQLNNYITLCEDAQGDWSRKREAVETKISEGSLKTELLKEYNQKYDDIQLLRVQLENARIEVLTKNIVNSN